MRINIEGQFWTRGTFEPVVGSIPWSLETPKAGQQLEFPAMGTCYLGTIETVRFKIPKDEREAAQITLVLKNISKV